MSSLESFNSNLEKLLKNLIDLFPTIEEDITNTYNFPLEGADYINKFLKHCKNKGQDISTKNEIIFSENSVVLEGVNFYHIWNDSELDDEQREIIWKYLHTLYIFSYEYQKDSDVKNILAQLKNVKSDDETIDEQTRTFLNIIESLTQKTEDIELEDSDEEADDSSGFSLPNMPDLSNLMNSSIGTLAQEIVSGLDTDKLNLEDPTQLLKGLMSGNIEENSPLMNIVKDITGKIHDKISSGQLNEEELYKDASNVMNTLNSSASKGTPDLFNNFFESAMKSGLAKGMSTDFNEETQEIINNCQQIVNKKAIMNKNPKSLQHDLKKQKRRELLRRKLELKKKIEQTKKKMELGNSKKEEQNNDSIDLNKWNEFQ